MSIPKKQINNLPDTPGVYMFVNKQTTNNQQQTTNNEEVLYVGKATSLRDRVRSYFSNNVEDARGPLIAKMLEEATDVQYEETDSVLEALILEARRIKDLQPPYNSKEKSDTSFNYVVITEEDYPRIFTVRGRYLQTTHDPDEFRYVFGPFPQGSQLKEALRIVRKIFPFRGEKDPVEPKERKSSLRREIGLVPDFSTVSKRSYAQTVRHIALFLDGQKAKVIDRLEKVMKRYAQKKEFEEAEEVKRQIFALQHIRDISLIKTNDLELRTTDWPRIEAYDVAHTAGTERVGVMVVLENGVPKKSDYRKFKIKSQRSKGDTGALREVLERRLGHDEWSLPKLIVVDGSTAQINAAESVLKEFGYQIAVVSVTKNAKHRPQSIKGPAEYARQYEREILLANSEAHRFATSFHRAKRKIK